ncbi:MAG TPA: O-antigen ligase family protein [Xanthomonadaceae bacterium]
MRDDTVGVRPATFVLACLALVAALLLGGSGGSFGDAIVQLLALQLIVLAAMEWMRNEMHGPDRLALAVMCGIVALAVVQLVPMPIAWWATLSGRAELLGQMRSAGVAPAWAPLSLDPGATERALSWTLPAIALFLAVRWTSRRQRMILLALLFAGALGLLMLGVTFHSVTGKDAIAAAGVALAQPRFDLGLLGGDPGQGLALADLFTNRNHFATLLAMTIPLVVAVGLSLWIERRRIGSKAWIPWAVMLALVVLGLLVGMLETRSRAALVLGGLSLLGSMALLWQMRLSRVLVACLASGSLVVAVLALWFSASDTLRRFDHSPATDMRWQIHATTLQAAHRFGPMGSGLGTFVEAYEAAAQESDDGPEYINRAHGDYHELWLETGVPGVALMALFASWFAWSAWRAWKREGQPLGAALVPRAATVSILLVLMHSYLDYPLRKTAILAVFGLVCALLSFASSGDVEKPGAAERAIP